MEGSGTGITCDFVLSFGANFLMTILLRCEWKTVWLCPGEDVKRCKFQIVSSVRSYKKLWCITNVAEHNNSYNKENLKKKIKQNPDRSKVISSKWLHYYTGKYKTAWGHAWLAPEICWIWWFPFWMMKLLHRVKGK